MARYDDHAECDSRARCDAARGVGRSAGRPGDVTGGAGALDGFFGGIAGPDAECGRTVGGEPEAGGRHPEAGGRDPEEEHHGGHEVTYTITATSDLTGNISYIKTDPPSMAAYNANSSEYLETVRVPIGGGQPLVYTATLADPGQWALVTASGDCGSTPSSAARSPSTATWSSPSRAAAA